MAERTRIEHKTTPRRESPAPSPPEPNQATIVSARKTVRDADELVADIDDILADVELQEVCFNFVQKGGQ